MFPVALPKNIELRKWQNEALSIWKEDLKGIIKVVTGGGKTLFAEACICEFFRAVGSKGKVLVVVPTIPLLDQWYLSILDDLGVAESDVALFSSRGTKAKKLKRFNIAVINSTRSWKLKDWADNGMIIVDECHRAATGKNSNIIFNKFRASLGLSATPERQYDLGLDRDLVPNLGKVIYEYSLSEALRDKVICPFKLINIKFTTSPEETTELKRHNSRAAQAISRLESGAITEDRAKLILIERARFISTLQMRVPLVAKVLAPLKEQKIIVFHESIAEAQRILNLLNSHDFQATIYHSKMSSSIRRDNLRLFRRGIYRVLVCCRSLDEGINIPDANIGVIASGTASSRQRIQRLGRVLRPAQGKDSATVFTFFATASEQLRLKKEEASLGELAQVEWLSASTREAQK